MIFLNQKKWHSFTKKNLFLGNAICTFFLQQTNLFCQDNNTKPSFTFSENRQDYSLIWSDEFNYDGEIDTNKWFHQTQIPNGLSWFNNEIQHYTNRIKNSYVSGGTLKIVAQKENYTDQEIIKNFTSARINSKFSFTYGRVEVKAKLPSGIGVWPAIWMLGKDIDERIWKRILASVRRNRYHGTLGVESRLYPKCTTYAIKFWKYKKHRR